MDDRMGRIGHRRRDHHAQRAEHAAVRRNQNGGNLQALGQGAGVQSSRAAEADQCEAAGSCPRRLVTARIACSMLASATSQCQGGFDFRFADLLRQLRDRDVRPGWIDRHRPAEETIGKNPAEDDVGIGDRRLRPARA